MARPPREQVPPGQVPRELEQGSADAVGLVASGDDPSRDARFLAVYGGVLLALALIALVVLVAVGADLPPATPFLGLAVVLALSVNRAVVFPSEYAATADLAVLLVAVVAFRDRGGWLGPLLLGLFAGALDHEHWRARAFSRLAWNAGNRGLAAVGAAGVFVVTVAIGGEPVAVLGTAAVLAAVTAAAIDGGLSIGMAVGRGSTLRSAWHELLDVDALVAPLAIAGAATGFLAVALGWWALVPPLVLVGVTPELLQARHRVAVRTVRNTLLGVEVGLVVFVASRVTAAPSPEVTVLLLAVGVAAGVELVADRHGWVPGAAGVVVVAAALAVGGGDAVFAGALVGASTTAVSWWCARELVRLAPAIAVVVAAGAGAGAGWLVSRDDHVGTVVIAGCGGLALFAVAALLTTRGRRRRSDLLLVVWGAPVAAGVLGAGALAVTRTGLAVAPIVALSFAAVLLAWCGSTPWRSRVLSPRLGTRGGRRRTLCLRVLGAVGVAAAVVAALTERDAERVAVVLATGCATGVVAMAAGAARQWTFAPRARARDATGLVIASLCIVGYPVAVSTGAWSSAAILAPSVVAFVVGREPVARSDAAAGVHVSHEERV